MTELISIAKAASEYDIPEGTLRYWIHCRRITSYRIGRRRKLKRADLDAFIERHREEAATNGL